MVRCDAGTWRNAGPPMNAPSSINQLHARRLGLLSQHEAVALVHVDCPICRSEGVSAHSRVTLTSGGKSIIATLYQVSADWLATNTIGLSETAWTGLGLDDKGVSYWADGAADWARERSVLGCVGLLENPQVCDVARQSGCAENFSFQRGRGSARQGRA